MSATHMHETARAQRVDDEAGPAAPQPAAHPAPVSGLLVGHAEDEAEHTADALADRALRRLSAGYAQPPGSPADDGSHQHEPDCGHLRRSSAEAAGAVVGHAGGQLDGSTSELIESRRGAGRPLPTDVRRPMESAFGTGLAHVRMHDDPTAARLNRLVSARAFTTGNDIFFGAGQFDPQSPAGQQVLAHELAHVISEPGRDVHRSWVSGTIAGVGKKFTWAGQKFSENGKEMPVAGKTVSGLGGKLTKVGKFLGRAKKDTPEEAKAKAEKKAEKERLKRKEEAEANERRQLRKEKKAKAKKKKAEEKAVKKGDKESASKRKKTSAAIYAGDAPAARVDDLNALFAEARAAEQSLVDSLAAEHAEDEDWTDERIADEAYRRTWMEGEYAEELGEFRPKRGTSVERAARERMQDREDAKEAAKASKALEKSEKAALKQSRAEGIAGRAALQAQVTGSDDPALAMRDLYVLMDQALEAEKALVADLTKKHKGDADWTEEQLADEAYRQIWLEGAHAEKLKPVRPARETAAERLVSEIRTARTNANVRQMMTRGAERGSVLPMEVEETYEKYVKHIDAALKGDQSMDPETAAAEAEALIWAVAPAKIRDKRPEPGSAVDTEAIKEARTRLALRPAKEVTPALGGLDKATEKVSSVTDALDTGLSKVGSVATKTVDLAMGESKSAKEMAADTAKEKGENLREMALSQIPGRDQAKEAKGHIETIRTAAKGGPEVPEPEEPTVKDNVTSGITSVLGMFTGLKVAVQSAMKFAKAVRKAHEEDDPRAALAAAKAGVDGLTGLTATATSSANFAKAVSPAVKDAVAKVIPGFNIFTAMLAVVSGAIDLADRAMRLGQTNSTIFEARSRDRAATKVDVMVYPMLSVAQRQTKQVEQKSFDTGVAISDVATSIATVATAGGFGIPAAVEAGVGLVKLLHNFGHFVGNEVLVSIAKRADKESSVMHLEGAAENALQKNPTTAVDGIIMRAAKGDETALSFLATYEVGGKAITAQMLAPLKAGSSSDPGDLPARGEDVLFTVRQAVLDDMGAEANPQHAYTMFKKKMTGPLKSVRDRMDKVNALAEQRNELDQHEGGSGGRGLFWRMKIMLTKAPAELNRAGKRAGVERRAAGLDQRADPDAPEIRRVLVTCGDAFLPEDPTDTEVAGFEQALEAMSTEEILKETANPANSPSGMEFLLGVCQERWKEEERVNA